MPKRGQLLKSAQNGTFSIRFRNDFRWVRDEPLAVALGHLARRLKMTTRARSAARCLKGAYPRRGCLRCLEGTIPAEGVVERCLKAPYPRKGLFEEAWKAQDLRKGLLEDG